MKALRIMAIAMMVSFVGVSFVACGGQKAEAPAEAAEAVEAVEAVADSCCAACDSCCAAADSCCAAADSCCAAQ